VYPNLGKKVHAKTPLRTHQVSRFPGHTTKTQKKNGKAVNQLGEKTGKRNQYLGDSEVPLVKLAAEFIGQRNRKKNSLNAQGTIRGQRRLHRYDSVL